MIFSEVNAILSLMDKKYVEKIPKKLLTIIKEKRDIKYIPQIDPNVSLANQNLQKDTLILLAILNINYWCTKEEKEELIHTYAKNDKKKMEELNKIYNENNLFKKKTKVVNKIPQNLALIEYNKQTFMQKLIEKLKEFFDFHKYNKF